MLNQLDDANDAEALRMLQVVSVPSAAADADGARPTGAPSRGPQVPVSIRFVAVSRITAFNPHDRPICATRERYQVDEDTAPPQLFRHAELLRDMLGLAS